MGVEVGDLVHVLLGDEVQHLGHVAVLDDGHALHRALALHTHAVHAVAAAGAAQLAQAVEAWPGGPGGPGGHGGALWPPPPLPSDLHSEVG